MASVSVNCHFCQREMEYCYREVGRGFDLYKCIHCPHNIEYYKYPNEQGILLTVQLKEKYYTIDFWMPNRGCIIYEVNKVGDWIKTIFELNFVPLDWNPTNIETKLNLALTFL